MEITITAQQIVDTIQSFLIIISYVFIIATYFTKKNN